MVRRAGFGGKTTLERQSGAENQRDRRSGQVLRPASLHRLLARAVDEPAGEEQPVQSAAGRRVDPVERRGVQHEAPAVVFPHHSPVGSGRPLLVRHVSGEAVHGAFRARGGHDVVDRRDGWRAPAVVASLVQGQVAAARHHGAVPDGGRAVQHLQLGARPPDAPQVHGHGRGPAQLEPRVLLLARGLGADDAAPGVRGQGVHGGHGGHGRGLGGRVAVPAVRAAGRRPVVRAAHRRPVVAVGRGPAGRPPGGRPAAARAHAARYVPDQQRGAHVGPQAVRQEHQPHREHAGVGGHVRRRMAQLPSHVPVGLQERRAARLQAEPVHAVHRPVLADRMGVRPEDGARRAGGQTRPAHRRRDPTATGRGRRARPRPRRRRRRLRRRRRHARVRLDRRRLARRGPANGPDIQEKRLVVVRWSPRYHYKKNFFFIYTHKIILIFFLLLFSIGNACFLYLSLSFEFSWIFDGCRVGRFETIGDRGRRVAAYIYTVQEPNREFRSVLYVRSCLVTRSERGEKLFESYDFRETLTRS